MFLEWKVLLLLLLQKAVQPDYCPFPFFDCGNNFTCINAIFVCDKRVDCHETGKDELGCLSDDYDNCTGIYCTDYSFRDGYDSRKCLPNSKECNAVRDCLYGNDERCECPENWLQCKLGNLSAGECLHPSKICDGIIDCIAYGATSVDECGCDESTFLCPDEDNYCLPSEYVCDHIFDCQSRADEINCTDTCNDGYFQCKSTFDCLASHHFCDKYAGGSFETIKLFSDCFDGSDETCDCNYNFACPGSNTCIEKKSFCRDISKCEATYEEILKACECNPITHHKCDDENICIPKSRVCDFVYDCPFSISDEANCSHVPEAREKCLAADSFWCSDVLRCVPCLYARKTHGFQFICQHIEGEYECPCDDSTLFKCNDGKLCINQVDVCDGIIDCLDGSDESICKEFECSADEHLCSEPLKCIKKTAYCNGVIDCKNGEDEKTMYCKDCNDFICELTEICLSKDKVCNGFYDCDPSGSFKDLSDESNCQCPEFKCDFGLCFSKEMLCNGEDDCYARNDFNDERYCSERDLFPKFCKKFKYNDAQIQYILNNVRLTLFRQLKDSRITGKARYLYNVEQFRLNKVIPDNLRIELSIYGKRSLCENPNWEKLYDNSKHIFLHLSKTTYTAINFTICVLNSGGMVFGVLGNVSIIIYSLVKCKKGNYNYLLIGNLAVVDLFMCIFRMSFRIVELFWGKLIYGRKEFSNFFNLSPDFYPLCYYVTSLRIINLCTSQWNLVGVALERFIMTKFPVKAQSLLSVRNRICFLFVLNSSSIALAIWFSYQSTWEFVSTLYPYAIHDFNLHCSFGFLRSYEINKFLVENSWYESLIFNNVYNLINRISEIFSFILLPVSIQSLLYVLVIYSSKKKREKSILAKRCMRFSFICLTSNVLYLVFMSPLFYHKIILMRAYWLRDSYISKSVNHAILPWSTDEKYNKFGLFALSQFDKYVFRTSEDYFLLMSAINPWIYIILSSEIRKRLSSLFFTNS